jgi:15-cis-phytoene synthase
MSFALARSEAATAESTSVTLAAPSAVALCRATIAQHSKSFALASRLLPPDCRDDAAALYTWCRRTDDAIDLAPAAAQPAALAELDRQLRSVYAGEAQPELGLAAFQEVVLRRRIPKHYPDELVLGMQMDACDQRYTSWAELDLYCYRVAGVVGLMMCHVMGVREPRALVNAAQLGMAMQLTNIARDVGEDWERGRLYLPEALLREQGIDGIVGELGRDFPAYAREGVARATAALLERADRYYAVGERGIPALSTRCGIAVRAAREVYGAIGTRVAAQGHDPLAPRAVVPRTHKLWLAMGAALHELTTRPPTADFAPAPLADFVPFGRALLVA